MSSFGIFENSKWEKRRVLYLIYRTRIQLVLQNQFPGYLTSSLATAEAEPSVARTK